MDPNKDESFLPFKHHLRDYKRGVENIVLYRDDEDYSCTAKQAVALAFWFSPSYVNQCTGIKSIAAAALKKYRDDEGGVLFDDWQKFCKVLRNRERMLYTFGMLYDNPPPKLL
jgi:hypothetical protein